MPRQAGADVNTKDEDGNTPLDLVRWYKDARVLERLLTLADGTPDSVPFGRFY